MVAIPFSFQIRIIGVYLRLNFRAMVTASFRIPQDREEVADRARKHEQMPNEVMEAKAVHAEKDKTERVSQASGHDQAYARRCHFSQNWARGDDGEPAHCDIQDN